MNTPNDKNTSENLSGNKENLSYDFVSVQDTKEEKLDILKLLQNIGLTKTGL